MASALVGSFGGFEDALLLLLESYECDPEAAGRFSRLAERLPRAGVANGLGAWAALLASVESAALLGERDRAAPLYPLVRQLMAGGAVVVFGLGLVERFAGMAASAGQAWTDAEAHFEHALRLAEELPHRVEQPEVRRWYARMLIDRDAPGDRERACKLLAEARASYQEIGMSRHVEMADALLQGIA